jgi:hypothetical protein
MLVAATVTNLLPTTHTWPHSHISPKFALHTAQLLAVRLQLLPQCHSSG